MIKNLKQQQSIFTKKSDSAENLLRASYIVGEMRESCANFQKKLFVYKTTKFKRKNRLLHSVES